MVSRSLRIVLLAVTSATLLILGVSVDVSAKELSEYRLGEMLEDDIVAPQKFMVVDIEATDALKFREAEGIPMVARFYPNIAGESETAFRKAFFNARNNFLNVAETQFHRQMPDPKTTDEFLKLAIAWPGLDKTFPLTIDLAGIWARGESDETFLNSLAAHLHEASQRVILPPALPKGWKTGDSVRLVALTNDVVVTPELVTEKGFTVARSNIISFSRARTEFRDGFPESERAWATFAVQFLKPNCAPDMKLTESVRAAHNASIQMGDTYQAGQVVARRGEMVDRKILAAIDRLRAITPDKTPTKPVPEMPATIVMEKSNQWVWFALGAVSLIAVAALWKLRRREAVSLLPARMSDTDVVAGSDASDLQEAVAPHLAELLNNKLTRRLISQRAELMATQKLVAAEIAELETRLEQVHAPLQERLTAYEKRIAELEQQLADKSEQNRELIQAKIEAVKQQMVMQRAKSRATFN